LDQQTLRGVRELDHASARLLDELLRSYYLGLSESSEQDRRNSFVWGLILKKRLPFHHTLHRIHWLGHFDNLKKNEQ
jgi:hypothetical protein